MRIRRAYREMFGREGGLEKRLFWFATFASMIVEAACILSDNLRGLNSSITAVNAVAFGLTVLNGFIASKTKKYVVCYTVLCLILNLVILPVIFIYAGGFHSGMPVYIMLGIVVCAVHPHKRMRYVTAFLAILGYVVTFVIYLNLPEVPVVITRESARMDTLIAIVISFLVILILMSFIVGDMNSLYNAGIREFQTKTRMRLELLEAQAENIEEAKHQRNEMRRHNMIVTEFAERGDAAGLLSYLQEKSSTDEKYNRKNIYCMNATINSVLDIYARQAQGKKIPMDIRTDVVPDVYIPDPELVNLVSNVLENAIAGAENSQAPEKKVSVDIHTKGSKLVISVKNSCNRKLALVNGYPGHPGIGTGIIEKIIRQYGGVMKYTIENGIIECRIIIQMGENPKK